jgi:hypothetical protein
VLRRFTHFVARAKPLSGDDERRRVAPREMGEQERFTVGGADLVEEQQGEFKIM